ncbi:hypothetical protein DM02DRAFT_629866 [Periconia macrospinosa]|uniref:Uncharacterized protein n=1 Tax=Periconia macrospinosa TaxID=97972 RepID=A0A2V1DNZ1_9PLEO|nr:hypothetical protein DM02DRAFT_629866 [Periconia macrospinosa]
MADPISIAGIILAIPPVAQLLLNYYTDAKKGKADIKRYIGELMSLKGSLDYIESIYFGEKVTWGNKKKDIKSHSDKLERVKSGVLMVVMGDSLLREEVRNDQKLRESQALNNTSKGSGGMPA